MGETDEMHFDLKRDLEVEVDEVEVEVDDDF